MLHTDIGQLYDFNSQRDISENFYSLTSRGVSKDIGSGLSLILGVLSTQTYAQAIWAAKTDSKGRKGAMLGTLLIPPIGIACIAIGLFMRGQCITVDEINQLMEMGKSVPEGLIQIENTAQVFPMFIIHFMPKLIGGIALGTLIITIVGGGAGLSLGASVILVEDVFQNTFNRGRTLKNKLTVTRLTIIAILIGAAVVAALTTDSLINDMGFLSMGLRGAVIFVPFTCALYLKGKINPKMIIGSIILGPLGVILGTLLNLPFDPLFLGVAINVICCVIGRVFPPCNENNM